MEKEWDWPVGHREGAPDLSHGEALYFGGVQGFNARSRNCKVVFINQFGFERNLCGDRMPADMHFSDIRKGSDVEFGQSIYEPFGIAQLEALSFGSICVMSRACGSAGFVERIAGPGGTPNVIVADYSGYRAEPDTIEAYKSLTGQQREVFEDEVARRAAKEILSRLPTTREEKAAFVRRGYELADRMSWDAVAREMILPALRKITAGPSIRVAPMPS